MYSWAQDRLTIYISHGVANTVIESNTLHEMFSLRTICSGQQGRITALHGWLLWGGPPFFSRFPSVMRQAFLCHDVYLSPKATDSFVLCLLSYELYLNSSHYRFPFIIAAINLSITVQRAFYRQSNSSMVILMIRVYPWKSPVNIKFFPQQDFCFSKYLGVLAFNERGVCW